MQECKGSAVPGRRTAAVRERSPAVYFSAVTAHFDNSGNNQFNPDPNQTVCGDMAWEEMRFPFFSGAVDHGGDQSIGIRIVRGSPTAR